MAGDGGQDVEYLTRQRAAEYLSGQGLPTTGQGLADQASDGKGPKYGLVRGRALYVESDLDAWLTEQLARPVTRRRHQVATERKQVA
jgi:hypothetical protein